MKRPAADPSAVAAGPRAAIAGAGIGLRACHIDQILRTGTALPWFELLADNHLAEGGVTAAQVDAVCARYPVTLHCVGMNLAGTDLLDRDYLHRVRALKDRSGAAWVSDHLCFTAHGGRHYHDLLPFPYTEESLAHVAERVLQIQDLLGDRLVVENVSSYLRFAGSALSEAEFLAELTRRADCLLLLDLNNLYVNQVNHGEDPDAVLAALPLERVREIHLAGHERKDGWLLDAHNARVSAPVWGLYARVARRLPDVPVLIEWDSDIPPLEVLLEDAYYAADDPTFDAGGFAALAADGAAAQARLQLSAALRLLASDYPVREIWRRHREGGDTAEVPAGDGEHLVIFRDGFSPRVEAVSTATWQLLRALFRGGSLEDLAAAGLAVPEVPALIQRRWIVGFSASACRRRGHGGPGTPTQDPTSNTASPRSGGH